MNEKHKGLISDLVPPIVLRGLAAVIAPRLRSVTQVEPPGEKDAAWYDASFERCEHWSQHYTESEYYFLWSVIADRVVRGEAKSILEIGCGTGQLASLIRDKATCKYVGLDFSSKRIQFAKQAYPALSFVQQDAFKTDLFATCDYDTVVCTEFLEHVEGDTAIIGRIRKGTRFFGTVPNFPFVSHVRHFHDEGEVQSRYAEFFCELRVDTFLATAEGKAFYLLDGEIL